MPDLSIIVPARNEQFLTRTVNDILSNMEGDTEIIVVCDGNWPDEPLEDHPRVTVVYHPVAIGQRAATNEGVRVSTAKYVMKCDAHVSFDKGFDVKLLADCQPNWVLSPQQRNLHAFSWLCDQCGNKLYQGPYPKKCFKFLGDGKTHDPSHVCPSQKFTQMIVWQPRLNTRCSSMRFDRELHFQYWREYHARQRGELVETMSILGACWMLERAYYWEIDGLDEDHGSWGQMGTELACKAWLSGGALMVSKKTWFAHMFRTQDGFTFPYPSPNAEAARRYSQRLWRRDTPEEMPYWPKAKYPLAWLLEKFKPIPDWHVPEAKT